MANKSSFKYFLFALIALLCVSNAALADLVTYWNFNEGTFTDASGNGYTGNLAGTAPTITNDGIVGKTFYGNASGKFNINISAANVNINNFTVSFWGKQTGANWKDYLSLYASQYGDSDFQRAQNSLSVYNSPWGVDINGSTDVSSGFHHFAFTSDPETGDGKLYIDGVLKATVNKSGISSVINNLMIGGNYMTGSRNGSATVDEVQLYNQPLSAEQIQFLYNNPSLYQATVYQRDVTANGNWSDADWNANGQTGQAFANSSAVQLDAVNSPTLTLDQNATVNSIDFNGSMTVSGNNTITLNGEKRITVANASDTATISAPITAQYGGITKDGAGTLKLTAANAYSGGTTITGGTLAVSTVNSLGTDPVTINGAALDASAAGASKTFNNDLVIGENGGTVATASGDYSFIKSITGTGDLTTKGYVHFNGTGEYSGHLTVSNGYTRVNPGAFGVFDLTLAGGHFNVFESGTVQIGKLNSTADLSFFGSDRNKQYVFEIGTGTTSSDTASFAGYIRGSADGAYNVTIKKVGEGTQTFNRSGYGYAGTPNSIKEVIVDGGKMIINANHSVYNAESTVGYWGSAPITINAGGTLVYDHVWNTSPNTMLTINGGTLTLNKAQYQNAITFNSGTVNGSDELRAGYNGTGVWTVKGGTSTINNKVVLVKSGNHTTFTVNFDSGATLDVKKNITGLNNYTGTNVTFNGTGENPGNILLYTASGAMTGLGSITFNNMNASIAKDGTTFWDYGYFNGSSVTLKDSTLTTSRDHSTNGTTFTLDHGTLTANGAVNTYIANVYLKNGSTINGTTDSSSVRTGHQWNSNIYTQYDEGQPEDVMNEISVDIAMYNTGRTMTFNIADKAPLTVSGSFVPAGNGHYNALVKTGAGTMTLTGQNSHGTTTVSEGTLVLSGNGTLGAGDVTIAENATLEFAHDSNQSVSNAISGAGNVVKNGNGTLTLTQEPGYTGSTTVESGTLALAQGGTLYNLTGGSVNDDGSVAVAAAVDASGKELTIDNAVMTKFVGSIKAGSIVKTGYGTLKIYADEQNKVVADTFTVSESELDFKGYYEGDLEVINGAFFSPGNSVGEANVTGNIAFITGTADSNGFTYFEFGDFTGADENHDLLVLSNSSLFNANDEAGVVLLDFANDDAADWASAGVDYLLVKNGAFEDGKDYTSWLTPTLTDMFSLQGRADGLYLTAAASPETGVPEPSTWALLALGAAGLMYWRKRK
ncbi:MAG: autotransporter-associated beta strand repeat-containing protein [Thermoguttaceae bacterium]|nr:autotransporter-associated beta strand repeat-containing protein [Thermoguttaceae bacterium]